MPSSIEPDSHETEILDYFGQKVGIDKGMSLLLPLLWKRGIKTTACCEGTFKEDIEEKENENEPCPLTYICFETSGDCMKFMERILLCKTSMAEVYFYPVGCREMSISFPREYIEMLEHLFE